jgi:hypothetical protein
MLEIGEGLVEIIESGRWDLGQDDERPDHSLGPNAASQPAETPAQARARREKRYWASMRTFQEALIITAPDFMHRQIGGYPKPIVPLDADTVRNVVVTK